MTVEELKVRPDFVTLRTDQMRDFVLAYCTNGADAIAAAESAYAVNSKESAVATANRNLSHPAIKRLVDDFYERADEVLSRRELAAIASAQIRAAKDEKVRLDWAKVLINLQGWSDRPAPEPEEQPSVDDLVRDLERKGKV